MRRSVRVVTEPVQRLRSTWQIQLRDFFVNLLPQISWVWVVIIIIIVGQWVRLVVYYHDQDDLDERLDRIENRLAMEEQVR